MSTSRLAEIKARLAKLDGPLQDRQLDAILVVDRDAPWLVAEVERLQGELVRLREAVRENLPHVPDRVARDLRDALGEQP